MGIPPSPSMGPRSHELLAKDLENLEWTMEIRDDEC